MEGKGLLHVRILGYERDIPVAQVAGIVQTTSHTMHPLYDGLFGLIGILVGSLTKLIVGPLGTIKQLSESHCQSPIWDYVIKRIRIMRMWFGGCQ